MLLSKSQCSGSKQGQGKDKKSLSFSLSLPPSPSHTHTTTTSTSQQTNFNIYLFILSIFIFRLYTNYKILLSYCIHMHGYKKNPNLFSLVSLVWTTYTSSDWLLCVLQGVSNDTVVCHFVGNFIFCIFINVDKENQLCIVICEFDGHNYMCCCVVTCAQRFKRPSVLEIL